MNDQQQLGRSGGDGRPPGRRGLSTGCIVALIVVAVILLACGICVAVSLQQY